MHILIVEDDERIISFMKRGLEAESYEVDIAASKSQTLDRTEARTYDAIILDIFLGPDDGLDICRTLRQRGVGSSILLMTAKGTPEMERMTKEAGADSYLAKPFSFDDLLATIAHPRKAGPPPDAQQTDHRPATGAPEHRTSAFTNSDHLRLTHMAVVDPDRGECFGTSTIPSGGQR